ncbi:ABC transporter ATP-binding protein [Fusobacterium ulcerans]|uniref:ABC transporter ATP-binding protein n=1 Tax=Fusobacterium ulcerans TaxID=861 RepID=UPI001D0AE4FC|nr:ABC transporter ATP-binding protein [Fusobacterium ulcerans]MCB8566545.1 ABC transporter ATP-binding protein/permease [Fusobacterium ulcerans]MCB8650227.1 ABC transporter ATP-binding protein/permease [Fusobacterium ulcerans]
MFKEVFALSNQGEKDLKKGILASAAANISLLFPAGLLLLSIRDLMMYIEKNGAYNINILAYAGYSVVFSAIILITHRIQYDSTYFSAYSESADRRVALAEKLRKLPLSFFGKKDLSELTITIMGDCTDLEHTFSHSVPQLFGSLISVTLVGIGLFVVNWKMALSAVFVFPIAIIITVGSKFLQDKMGKKKIDAKLAASDKVQEYLENIREIKSYNIEEKYLNDLDDSFFKIIKASLISELTTGTLIVSAQGILRLGFAAVTLTGIQLFLNGEIDFLVYLMYLFTISRLYDPLSVVLIQIGDIFNSLLTIKRMKDINEQKIQEGAKEFSCDNYDIVFENVEFAYNNNEKVLNGISFVAEQGQITVLAGESGGGKSTAVKLAARFWDVTKGKITLGGVDISTVDPEVLLEKFSIVFQDVVLFNGTILENIRIGKRGASDEEVYMAAKAAQCDEFIKRFPLGYNTVIGENGSTLSGGERQRISIARALLKDAPIILLDEATASLDVENETLIQSALGKLIKNKTVLLIAHRMRTAASADKIIILKDGKIAEQGSPKNLMKIKGMYYKMVELQNQNLEYFEK